VGSFSQEENARLEIISYNNILENDEDYKRLFDSGEFKFSTYHGKKYHSVIIRPFKDRKEAIAVLDVIHQYKKAPYLGTYKTEKPIQFKDKKESSSSSINIEKVDTAFEAKKAIATTTEKIIQEKPKVEKIVETKIPAKIVKSDSSSFSSIAPTIQPKTLTLEEVKTPVNSTLKQASSYRLTRKLYSFINRIGK
jgi:hypothetical protein